MTSIEILGAPVDLGADRRGVDMGPSAIRYAGLVAGLERSGLQVTDLGNLPIMLAEPAASRSVSPSAHLAGRPKTKYVPEILAMTRTLAEAVGGVMTRGNIPLVLGGDHSVSLGSVSGAVQNTELGLLWMDAHGDFNTPDTTPSGNVHGMILAALSGRGDPEMVGVVAHPPAVPAERIALVGVRDLDPGERELLRDSPVKVFTMADIDRCGIAEIMTAALKTVLKDSQGFHLSLDMDVVDPARAPGVGTPVPGGVDYREGQLAMEMIAAHGGLRSMDVVEVNPILDDHNQTAQLAVDFVLSALGKTIL